MKKKKLDAIKLGFIPGEYMGENACVEYTDKLRKSSLWI